MKIKNTIISTCVLLISISTLSVYAGDRAKDEDSDLQQLTVSVPEVSLIDVSSELSVKLEPPTDAGNNFKNTVVDGSPNYDISANIAADGSVSKKKIIAKIKDIPDGWKVTLDKMEAPKGANSASNVVLGTIAVDTVTGIKNVAARGLGMQLSVGPESEGVMPSYTEANGKTIDITYTITAE